MKEKHYCSHCEKETTHNVEIERDANNPPESFIEAEKEGYDSSTDAFFTPMVILSTRPPVQFVFTVF